MWKLSVSTSWGLSDSGRHTGRALWAWAITAPAWGDELDLGSSEAARCPLPPTCGALHRPYHLERAKNSIFMTSQDLIMISKVILRIKHHFVCQSQPAIDSFAEAVYRLRTQIHFLNLLKILEIKINFLSQRLWLILLRWGVCLF